MPPHDKEFNRDSMDKVLNFINTINCLKKSGEATSPAEHCWQASVLLMAITPYLDVRIDLKQALKMSILQGIYQLTDETVINSHGDSEVLKAACLSLDGLFGLHFYELSDEYHQQVTYESKVVKAIDHICRAMSLAPAEFSVRNNQSKGDEGEACLSFDSGLVAWNHYVSKVANQPKSTIGPQLA